MLREREKERAFVSIVLLYFLRDNVSLIPIFFRVVSLEKGEKKREEERGQKESGISK